MTTHSTDKINWYYCLIGLFALFVSFYSNKTEIQEMDLETKTIILYKNIEFIKGGSRSNSFFRLWTTERGAAFTIDNVGQIAAKLMRLDSLKKGDSLIIKYNMNRESDLNNKAKEIPIYFLQKANSTYFDSTTYNQAQPVRDKRLNILILIAGLLLILRGFTIINSKVAYILAGLAIATILVLRLLDKF